MNSSALPSVREVLEARYRDQSQPGQRTDTYKIGLCVEGGAMRGVVTAAQLVVLELLGMKGLFDVIYGSSAGAFNAAFFASNQTLYGIQIYLNEANNKFINVRRPLRGKKILDLEYILDDVMINKRPIDWEKAVSSKPPLRIIATDAIRAKSTVVPIGHSQTSLFAALRASAHIPGAHGTRPYHLGGKLLWDAAILDPFCLDVAIAEGCTHLLVLMSMPLERERQPGLTDRYFIAPHLKKFSPALCEAYLEKYSQDLDTLEKILLANENPKISAIAPPLGSAIPPPLSKNRKKLGKGVIIGASSIMDALHLPKDRQHAVLMHVKSSLSIS